MKMSTLKATVTVLVMFIVSAMFGNHIVNEWRGDVIETDGYYMFYTCDKTEFLEHYASVSEKTERVKVTTEKCFGRTRYVLLFEDYMETK